MPLVTCPDCGKEVSDSAPACVGCGRPMESAPAPTEPSARADPLSPPAWECPGCGGSQFKKFSLLYEEHRSTSTSKTTGLGLGLGAGGLGLGVGGAKSKGISMTELARRVSPPHKRDRSASLRWSQSYLCLRCGEGVIAGDNGELQIRDKGDAEVDRLLREGRRIQAVKAMMDSTGLGLAEAKKRVDARARDLNV